MSSRSVSNRPTAERKPEPTVIASFAAGSIMNSSTFPIQLSLAVEKDKLLQCHK